MKNEKQSRKSDLKVWKIKLNDCGFCVEKNTRKMM